MKILTSVCLLFIVGFCTSSSQAQDIHYSMFDMAPLELNPTYTGYYGGLEIDNPAHCVLYIPPILKVPA